MTKETTHVKAALGKTDSEPPHPAVPHEAIEQAVRSIQFGVVQLIIHDGRVVQIDKTEKIRLV